MFDDNDRVLYRVEYYEPLDETFYVNWVWLKLEEMDDYLSEFSGSPKVRRATEEESDIYQEAYADGYSIAAYMEYQAQYDGITFRVEIGEDGKLNMRSKKMFQCAVCDRHLDFEESVSSAGGMYLGAVRDDKLWHICYDCAQGRAEVEWIEQGWVWDDDSGSTDEKSS